MMPPDGTNHERFLVTMREVQGGIITSALFIMAFAMSGLLRAVLHYISPLTVAVNIGIVGLSLYSSGFRSGFRAACHFVLHSAKVVLLCLLRGCTTLYKLPDSSQLIGIPSHSLFSAGCRHSRKTSPVTQLLFLALSTLQHADEKGWQMPSQGCGHRKSTCRPRGTLFSAHSSHGDHGVHAAQRRGKLPGAWAGHDCLPGPVLLSSCEALRCPSASPSLAGECSNTAAKVLTVAHQRPVAFRLAWHA